MKLLFVFLFSVMCATVTNAQNEERVALVIGNGAYSEVSLKNAVTDAKDIASKFRELGFDVMLGTDVSFYKMGAIVEEFGKQAQNCDVAVVYYSGHGIQSGGDNFLVPVDARLYSEADIPYACENINHILSKLEESGCDMKVVILDACRNNPFERRWRSSRGRGLSFLKAPKGTIIAYATTPGETADDGIGRNSPYTTALLEILNIPDLPILDFFNYVGNAVEIDTNGKQIPWISSSALVGNFCFNRTVEDVVDSNGSSISFHSLNINDCVTNLNKESDTKSDSEVSKVLTPIKIDGKWGYSDANDNVQIPAKYDEAREFSASGLAVVRKGKRYGFINYDGRTVGQFVYKDIMSVGQENYWVKKGHNYGILDHKGQNITGLIYDYVEMSNWGLIVCQKQKGRMDKAIYDRLCDMGLAFTKKKLLWGMLDTNGKFLIPLRYDFIFHTSDADGEGPKIELVKHGQSYYVELPLQK